MSNHKDLLRFMNRNGVYLHMYIDEIEVTEGLITSERSVSTIYLSDRFDCLSRLAKSNETCENNLYLTGNFCQELDPVLTKYIVPEESVLDSQKNECFDLFRVYYNKLNIREDIMNINLSKPDFLTVLGIKKELVDLIIEHSGVLEILLLDNDLSSMFRGINLHLRDALIEIFNNYREANYQTAAKVFENLIKEDSWKVGETISTVKHTKRLFNQVLSGEESTLII